MKSNLLKKTLFPIAFCLLPMLCISLCISCGNRQSSDELPVDSATQMKIAGTTTIDEYISHNNIKATPTPSGLYIIVNKEGNGKKIIQGSQVTVDYVLRLLDGTIIDCSREDIATQSLGYKPSRIYEPFTYTVGQVALIKGWDEGLYGQAEGSEITLIIPPSLAYGEKGAPPHIAPNTPLIFEITILKVVNDNTNESNGGGLSVSSFENRINGTTWVSRNGCQKFEIYNGHVRAYLNSGGYWQEINSVSSQYSLSEDENAIYMKFGSSDNRTTIVFYKQTNTVIYRDGDNGTIQGQLEQEYI